MKIESKDLFAEVKKKHSADLAAAFKSKDPDAQAAALTAFFEDMRAAVLSEAAAEIDEKNHDRDVLAHRGANQLTAAETEYWNGLAAAWKSADPQAAIANYEVAMPQTVIDRVVESIRKSHRLLDKINFVSTSYLTRILTNAKTGQLAAWGKITGPVKQEIEGAVKEVQVTMCKLSAFMCVSMDLVELGPAWIDTYVRETLAEAIAAALEKAVVAGTGKDEPVGMVRDMSSTAAVVDGVRPMQKATEVKWLDPKTVGGLVKKLARDPNDATGETARAVDPRDIIFVFNPFDYWEKVFPGTTAFVSGQYVSNLLPIPAEIFQSDALSVGQAIIGIAPNYFMGVGQSGKTGTIVADDSVKFLEDQRAWKAKLHGNGMPMDEYSFLLLDVSKMEGTLATTIRVAADINGALPSGG